MDIDRQAIERRDFPIARRGYDPAAVDAHLRALAAEMEELSRRQASGEEQSLATAASSQVQGILHAAEQAAADIEREAQQRASDVRSAADSDAHRTREEAIAKAREHVAGLAQATAALHQRITSIDGEAKALLENLRGGADRLAGDLAALDANMGKLYDAASGRSAAAADAPETAAPAPATERAQRRRSPPAKAASAEPAEASSAARMQAPSAKPADALASESAAPAPAEPAPTPAAASPGREESLAGETAAEDNGDMDGARLVALNMALSGESRDATERYLAEHFRLAERHALIEEVYAAVEA